MASAAAGRTGGMHLIGPVFLPAMAAGAAYTWWRVDWKVFFREFFGGPGRNSRVLMLLFFLLNLKSMPLAWTVRVFNAFIYHTTWGKAPVLGPRALFAPMVSQTHAPLLEIDYNMHKSNSTYFSDLDVSRSHLVTYLTRPALVKLRANAKTKVVLDPTGAVARGETGVMLGAVQCSFRREIAPYAAYEMWSRILAWDRKWLYVVTHFVPKGVARPKEWLDRRLKKVQTRKPGTTDEQDWSKKIYATALSKYVFKIGRLTVHPAIVLEQSHLLPPRPGGWRGGADDMGEQADLGDAPDGEQWDWRRVERERRKGMEFAQHFMALEGLEALFDGGSDGAIGKFGLG